MSSADSAHAGSPPPPLRKHANTSHTAKRSAAAANAKMGDADWQPHALMNAYKDHQIDVPFTILASLAALHKLAPAFLPFLGLPHAHHFLIPTGPVDPAGTGYVAKSATADFAFLVGGVIFWTLVRAVTIDYVLKPLARKLRVRRGLVDRFGEQGWLVVYYSLSFTVGAWYVYEGGYFSDTRNFWRDYPRMYLPRDFKAYFLLQMAFWVQQLLVIHIERPRKDHYQMLTHHVVTVALVICAYLGHFTRPATSVLCYLDVGDIFLCLAKCLNYARFRTLCDMTFGFFVLVWLYSRHYLYLAHIIPSIAYETGEMLEWKWAPEEGHYVSDMTLYFFLGLLGALQVLLVMWLYLIIRVILKVVRGNGAEDNRSDDEDEDGGVGTEADEVVGASGVEGKQGGTASGVRQRH